MMDVSSSQFFAHSLVMRASTGMIRKVVLNLEDARFTHRRDTNR